MSAEILISTTPSIPGYKIVRSLGIVHGMTARTRGLAGKILGGLQSLAGGEVTAFTSEIDKAKDEALERLKVNALKAGANGVIGVDFETTEVFQSVVLVSAHGTAVMIERD
jgi:uncharacterized protein YbjQ (UPF0145 family)